MTNINDRLIAALNSSKSEYHSVHTMKQILIKNGYKELSEGDEFNLENGGKYFITRNLSSVIALKLPKKLSNLYFRLVASHTDSPTYKVKSNPVLKEHGYEKLKVEPYGGMIVSSWLDKPLGIAGRIIYKKDNEILYKLVDSNSDTCIIPNVAIHQNRDINNGFKYNNQIDLCPIVGTIKEGSHYDDLIHSFLKEGEEFISEDLYLYNREETKYLGFNKDFITGSKLDDLSSAFTTLYSFIESFNTDGINVFTSFNNEEVGSLSNNGADSTFLAEILRRVVLSLGKKEEDYYRAISKSILFSVDNAHAIHPNHPEMSDNKNECLINEGVVIKHNANMLYTSDALSTSFVKTICNENQIKYQEFFNRSDVRGGSTLGNISNSHVSLLSVDIGLPQLAMHSNYELIGSKDISILFELVKVFMEKNFELKDATIKLF